MLMTLQQYRELSSATNVLFVDVAPAAAIQDFKASFPSLARGKQIAVAYAPTFWYHEATRA